jgi:hypothetical protein
MILHIKNGDIFGAYKNQIVAQNIAYNRYYTTLCRNFFIDNKYTLSSDSFLRSKAKELYGSNAELLASFDIRNLSSQYRKDIDKIFDSSDWHDKTLIYFKDKNNNYLVGYEMDKPFEPLEFDEVIHDELSTFGEGDNTTFCHIIFTKYFIYANLGVKTLVYAVCYPDEHRLLLPPALYVKNFNDITSIYIYENANDWIEFVKPALFIATFYFTVTSIAFFMSSVTAGLEAGLTVTEALAVAGSESLGATATRFAAEVGGMEAIAVAGTASVAYSAYSGVNTLMNFGVTPTQVTTEPTQAVDKTFAVFENDSIDIFDRFFNLDRVFML